MDGHDIFITARNKDVTHQLLDNYNIPLLQEDQEAIV